MPTLRISLLLATLLCSVVLAQTGPVNIVNGVVDLSGATSVKTPTPAVNDASTTAASTSFVQSAIAAAAPGPTTQNPTNQLISGGGVHYTGTGLVFNVGAAVYMIQGVTYSSPAVQLTLTAANMTFDRVDAFIVDTSGTASFITGMAAATPLDPNVAPETQLELRNAYVAANASQPSNFGLTTVYDEGTEWTFTSSTARIVNGTTNPYHLTHAIVATAAVLGDNVTLVKPAAGTFDPATLNNQIFYIRTDANWPTGNSGANAARFLSFTLLNGSTQVGVPVVIRDGTFGFSSLTHGVYQQISFATSLFGANGKTCTTLKLAVTGNTGTSAISFDIDWINLQSGFNSSPNTNTSQMNFQGTYNPTKAYSPNDVVVSGGFCYIALVSNTGIALTVGATWATCATVIHPITASFGGSGALIPAGTTSYTTLPYACTIAAWNIVVDAGTATFDIWKIGTGTAIPTVSNSITASAQPAIATGTAIHSTTMTGWSLAVTKNDIVGINLKAVSGATYANIALECE